MAAAFQIPSKNNALVGEDGIVASKERLSACVLARLAVDWQALATDPAEPNAFLEHWMVSAALELLPRENIWLVSVRQGGGLIGLVLLREARGYAHLPLGLVKTALHTHQFLGTPLVRRGCEMAFASGLCRWLDTLPAHIEFCQLTHLAGDGPVARALRAVCDQQGRACDEIARFERAMIKGQGQSKGKGATCLMPQMSANLKKQVRRKSRKLSELGLVAFQRLETGAQAPCWLEDFLCMEHKSWKGAAGTSILSSADEVTFFKRFVGEAAERGALRFSRLTLDGKAIAYALDLVAGRTAFAHKVAYDPAYGRLSPGLLLDYHLLTEYYTDPEIDLVDSSASASSPVRGSLWDHKIPIVQLLLGRKGLRHELLFGIARTLENGAASMRSLRGA